MIDKDAIAARIAAIIGVGLERSHAIVDAFENLFVGKVVEKLAGLKVKELVERKNPYLYRATGVSTCEEYIQRAFREYVAGMRWTYFGHFCESVAQIMSGGIKPEGKGEIDLEIWRGGEAFLYAIKSGASGLNASSQKKAIDDLDSAANRFAEDGVVAHKKIGFGYGRRVKYEKNDVELMASKDFWAEMSGDEDFYIKLLDVADALSPLFQVNLEVPDRLLAEANELFCEGETIRWDKVIRLVSG